MNIIRSKDGFHIARYIGKEIHICLNRNIVCTHAVKPVQGLTNNLIPGNADAKQVGIIIDKLVADCKEALYDLVTVFLIQNVELHLIQFLKRVLFLVLHNSIRAAECLVVSCPVKCICL